MSMHLDVKSVCILNGDCARKVFSLRVLTFRKTESAKQTALYYRWSLFYVLLMHDLRI